LPEVSWLFFKAMCPEGAPYSGAPYRIESFACVSSFSRHFQGAFLRGGGLGKRLGVSAYRRLGNKTAFLHGYNDQEVSTKLMTLCKRRPADSPIRFPYPPTLGGETC
jgi:hypothetical protein